jgi:hypothetical protein
MRNDKYSWRLAALAALALSSSVVAHGDTIISVPLPPGIDLVTSFAGVKPNDWTKWSQLGADQTAIAANFNATSAAGVKINGSLQGGNNGGLLAVECPPPPAPFPFPCSWTGGNNGASPFSPRDTLIWTFDGSNYNAPLSLSFGRALDGAGLLIQAESPGQYTAQIEAFLGGKSLGTFTEKSDVNGDPEFIGVLGFGGQTVSSITLSLTSCTSSGDQCSLDDFAVDTLYTKGGPNATPEPASMILLAIGLTGFGCHKLQRRAA